ncbi:serine hydrolase [Iningainema tapete]|uniref:Serine hydrolase n=1 Tax=Iningainema tapete BLCC-T55 TaxID=2748662 RepID=A0A8J6XNZ3_9CYAN|nr:serine hydrolase [Iningainema tapete]MBD2771028.1 serine hydrolase [Iningainema tapete BLCC-T55]
MQKRTATSAFSRRQPQGGHQDQRVPIQNIRQDKVKVTKSQSASKVRPIASIGRKGVMPSVQPTATIKGKIPPFNPNAVRVEKIPPFNPHAMKPKTKVRVRKQTAQKSNSSRRARLKPMARTILYAMRLLIVGVGIGAIVGTVLSILDPATRITTAVSQSHPQVEQTQSATPSNTPTASGLFLSQENTALKTAVQTLAAGYPNLQPGVFLVDLENGAYVDVNASTVFPAASTIKIPMLIAFFQDVDAGKIRLDETLTLQKEMVAGGSGEMQYKPVGTQFTALEVATKMMTVSDNTATNMLISRLGGIELLNQRFQSWGLTNTAIRNLLPDLQGTNSTSPKELGNLMAMVSKGNLVSMPSRDRILDIMRRTIRNHLLPTGLGTGATIAHKTGDIGTMLADAGLVDMPSGKRYIVAVMVQRPKNDPSAEKLIKSISQAAYQQFTQGVVVPPNTTVPVPPTSYQSPVITPPFPNGVPGTMPPVGYQPQPPTIAPGYGNPPGSVMPPTGYQAPMMNPQYYYPYQR